MIQNPFNPTTIFTRYRYITIALLLVLTHYMIPTAFGRVTWVTGLSEIIYIIIGNLIVVNAQKQHVRTYVTLWMIGMCVFAVELFSFVETLQKVFHNPFDWKCLLYTIVVATIFAKPVEQFVDHKYPDFDHPTQREMKQPNTGEQS